VGSRPLSAFSVRPEVSIGFVQAEVAVRDAACGQRGFFYGVNFEISNETPPFAQTRFALEIRPIIGIRKPSMIHRQPDRRYRFRKIWRGGFRAGGPAGEEACPGSIRGFDIILPLDSARSGTSRRFPSKQHTLVRRDRFQGRHLRCELRRRLRPDVGFRSLVVKSIIGYAFRCPAESRPEQHPSVGPVNRRRIHPA